MPLTGDYEPSPYVMASDQVDEYEASAGAEANTLMDTGLPILIVTMRGRRSGKLRKVPLMTVEHEGEYALVASKGGAPTHPAWYWNLMADPNVMIQDGPEPMDYTVRLAEGEDRAVWWERAVAAFPTYARYQAGTDREIPLFVATPI